MPHKPMRPCRYSRCPQLTDDKTGYCDAHRQQVQRQYDRERGSANERGYDYHWQQYSKHYLMEHPLCALCAKKAPPVIKASECIDHIIPHRGDYNLFWNRNNHQPACLECNSVKAATEEGAFGNPSKKSNS
jgi:5-methylcytosine-specific restriction protein A